VLLSVLTEQIKIGMNMAFVLVMFIFITVLVLCVYFLVIFSNKMKKIIGRIDEL